MALGQRRYICTVYRVIPFNPTGYIRYVAGGRLPPLHARIGWYRSTPQVIIATPRNGTQAVPYILYRMVTKVQRCSLQ